MIRSHPETQAPWTEATWIDLCEASEEERAAVESATRVRVPTEPEINEIETTSRAFVEKQAFYLSTPLPVSSRSAEPLTAAGFVLTKERLVTVRFATNVVFDSVYKAVKKEPKLPATDVFLRVLEAMVDRAADSLERCSSDLDGVSHEAFHAENVGKQPTSKLRDGLLKLGQMADWVSKVRDTLLGLGRIAAFVCETGNNMLSPDDQARVHAIRADIASLNDYQMQLSGKVQFLLDATLGFINIEQNEVVKILTIVSVVGVPPVLIAGIYGMNFKYMPELDWHFGYPVALIAMVVTGLMPIAWFKWRGWM